MKGFDDLDRRTFIGSTVSVSLIGLAGCSLPEGGSGETEQGMLATAVSDQPAAIGDFESLVLRVNEIEVYPAGSEDEEEMTEDGTGGGGGSTDGPDAGEDMSGDDEPTMDGEEDMSEDTSGDGEETESGSEEDGGPIVITLDEPAEFDLVKLQGDAQSFINEETLDVGEYSQIKLRVSDEVDAVLKDGGEAEVVTPGNAPLMFKQDFEIRPNTRTEFTADFAPHRRGPNGYILRPVAAETTVSYTEIESSESSSDGGEDSSSEGGETSTNDEEMDA